MPTFQKVKLGDLFTLEYGKGLIAGNRVSGDFPVYGSSGRVGTHTEYLVEGPGIIVGRKGSVGEVYFSKNNFYPIDTTYYISKDDRKYDVRYLYYFLKQLNLKRLQGDTGVPGLNRNTAYGEIVNFLSDILAQTKIADVLSAYDDLIENNEKRIKALEQMAQLLYTEWFVRFEFPVSLCHPEPTGEGSQGYKSSGGKMIDSHTPYGPIPEGWEVKNLGDIADLIMGQSPTSDNYNLEKSGLPFHQGVADFGYKYPVDRVYSNAGNKYAESSDLLFSVRAPVGRMNIANKKIILGRGLCAIRHKQCLQSLLFLMFASKFTEKDMIGNGAIYKSVNRAELENIKFVYPAEKIALGFENIASKYFDKMQKLTALNQNLAQTRDLLIPQLVTGKRQLK